MEIQSRLNKGTVCHRSCSSSFLNNPMASSSTLDRTVFSQLLGICTVLLHLSGVQTCRSSPTATPKVKATSACLSLSWGLQSASQLDMREGLPIQLKDDARNNGMIENAGFDFENEFEFWPIQHPTEPSHEDRPVQCPIPHSSHLINEETMEGEQFSERKRPEASTIPQRDNSTLEATETPIRAVRKRHHDHTMTITPLLRMPPAPACPHLHPIMNQTDFNKLQQVHRFKS